MHMLRFTNNTYIDIASASTTSTSHLKSTLYSVNHEQLILITHKLGFPSIAIDTVNVYTDAQTRISKCGDTGHPCWEGHNSG